MSNGNGVANTLDGYGGDDTVFGNDGNDTLSGDNYLESAYGNDSLSGGDGDDVICGNRGQDQLSGDQGSDWLWGGNDADTLMGGNDGDVLNGDDGADRLEGGSGNDPIYGHHDPSTLNSDDGASDTLLGGAGNDTLSGGSGSDTYYFGRSEGSDTLQENTGTTDSVIFTGGVAPNQIWFSRVGSDLEISIIGTTDVLTVDDWYSGTAYHVEQFIAGSATLLDTQVDNLVNAMAGLPEPSLGQTTLSPYLASQLEPVIAANWH